MIKFNKILVLENDIERQGIPDHLEDVLDTMPKIPREVWWWFSQDVIQHPKEAMVRFKSVDKDTLVVTMPSFIGWDNSFERHLHLFEQLKNLGIRLRIAVLNYPCFYNFLVHWLYDIGCAVGDEKIKNKNITLLKELLEFHEIYDIQRGELYKNCTKEPTLVDVMKRITWEWLDELYFREGSFVKMKDGIVKKVQGAYVNKDEMERSCVHIENIPGEYNSNRDAVLFSEVTKVKPKKTSKGK